MVLDEDAATSADGLHVDPYGDECGELLSERRSSCCGSAVPCAQEAAGRISKHLGVCVWVCVLLSGMIRRELATARLSPWLCYFVVLPQICTTRRIHLEKGALRHKERVSQSGKAWGARSTFCLGQQQQQVVFVPKCSKKRCTLFQRHVLNDGKGIFTVDEGGSAEPTRDKNIIGMYRRRGSSPPPPPM